MTLTLHPRGRYRRPLLSPSRPTGQRGVQPVVAAGDGLRLAGSLAPPALPGFAPSAAALVIIGVVDPANRMTPLAAALPETWRLAVAPVGPLADALDHVARAGCDALLLVDADGHSVRTVRAKLPATPIVALLRLDAPAAGVVDVLQGGADACVRGADPAPVLVAHLRACLRRRRAVHQ